MGALAGIVVIAIEQAVAAPLCTMRLAEAGARVIKIERQEGDFARGYDRAVAGQSAYFVWLNRGKESIAIDLKNRDDAALLHRMIGRADVVVQNLAPGAAARAGFGSAALRAAHPALVTCDISGYGEDGPAAAMKAYDFLIQCETGLAAITGSADAPGRVGVSIADIGCGMNAHAAILQALYERTHTGRGRGIAVSLFDAVADWMTVPLLFHEHGGGAPPRAGLSHPTIAPYGAFTVGDGSRIVIAIQNEREWRNFCEGVLQRSDLAGDARFLDNSLRCANRVALEDGIASVFERLDATALVARLAAAGIAYARLNEVADLARHSQLQRVTADTPLGPVSLPAPATRWDGETATAGAVPGLDADGLALRREFA